MVIHVHFFLSISAKILVISWYEQIVFEKPKLRLPEAEMCHQTLTQIEIKIASKNFAIFTDNVGFMTRRIFGACEKPLVFSEK